MPSDEIFAELSYAEERAQELQDQTGGRRSRSQPEVGYWAVVLLQGQLTIRHSSEFPDADSRAEMGPNWSVIHRAECGPDAWQPPAELLHRWEDERLEKLSREAFGLYNTLFGRYTAATKEYLASSKIHDEELSARAYRVRRVMTRCRERSERRSAALTAWREMGDKLGFVP